MSRKISDVVQPVYQTDDVNDLTYNQLTLDQIKEPPSDDLIDKFKQVRKTNRKVDQLWSNTIDMKPSRSERDFTLAKELKLEGFTLNEAAKILWSFKHGKVRETKYPNREIIRCYERSGNDIIELDQDYLDKIEKQTNPILAAKAEVNEIIEKNSDLITLDKVDINQNSIPLVKGLIDRNTTNLLYGPSTGGKSFLMIDLAISLAKGDEFWDQYRIKEKSGVLIVVGEGGGGYHKRVAAAMRKHEITKLMPEDVPFGFITGYYNMFDQDEAAVKTRKKITDAVQELERKSGCKVRLVIYDTMSKMLGSGNENNASDVRVFQANVEKIGLKLDLASLIIHHVGKDETVGARGSIALLADMDSQLRLSVKKTNGQRLHFLSSPKQKDHADDKITTFKLNVVELAKDSDGDPIDSCQVVLQNDDNKDLFPSITDELNGNDLYAYMALKWFDILYNEYGEDIIVYGSHIKTKAYIFWFLKNNFNECRGLSFDDVSGFDAKLMLKKGGEKIMDAKLVCDNMRIALNRCDKLGILVDGDIYELKQEFK